MDSKKKVRQRKERDSSESSYEGKMQTKKSKLNEPILSGRETSTKESKEMPKKPRKATDEDLPKKLNIELINKNKMFSDILTQANREPEFLMKLRNLLSGCNRTLQDKKELFKKKKQQLHFSNCSQQEYMKREDELKRLEIQEVREIKQDIMNKLGYFNTKGFENKQTIMEHWREMNPGLTDLKLLEVDYEKHRADQLALLDMLMKESDLVSQEYNSKIKYAPLTMTSEYSTKPIEDNTEMDLKFNNLDSEENPQNVQFFFMKQFNNLNYGRIFENTSSLTHIEDKDKFFMSKKTYSWLIDSKSDQIYSNEKFQGETYDKYTRLLRDIHDQNVGIDGLSNQVIEDLLQIATYVLNSIHYYQKFKLRCPIMHPVDVMYVIEKIRSKRSV